MKKRDKRRIAQRLTRSAADRKGRSLVAAPRRRTGIARRPSHGAAPFGLATLDPFRYA